MKYKDLIQFESVDEIIKFDKLLTSAMRHPVRACAC